MLRNFVRKGTHVVLVLLIVAFATTFMLDLTPGDPAYALLGENATPEQVAQVHSDLGLDKPILDRYWTWLGQVASGDFGQSYQSRSNVLEMVTNALPVTAEIVLLSFAIALMIAIPIGTYSAYRPDGKIDRLWAFASSSLISLPSFVTALVLVYVLAIHFRIFPATGWAPITDGLGQNLWHAFLPALTLALVEIPAYSRLLRADMIATLQDDYILAARARGVPTRRILVRHALRPSSFSLITLAGLSLGRLVGGAVIVESIFALPGLGQLLLNSILSKDVLVIQGAVMFIAIVYVSINMTLDVIYGAVDPRVRLRRR